MGFRFVPKSVILNDGRITAALHAISVVAEFLVLTWPFSEFNVPEYRPQCPLHWVEISCIV